jgi:hypothetical protein
MNIFYLLFLYIREKEGQKIAILASFFHIKERNSYLFLWKLFSIFFIFFSYQMLPFFVLNEQLRILLFALIICADFFQLIHEIKKLN